MPQLRMLQLRYAGNPLDPVPLAPAPVVQSIGQTGVRMKEGHFRRLTAMEEISILMKIRFRHFSDRNSQGERPCPIR